MPVFKSVICLAGYKIPCYRVGEESAWNRMCGASSYDRHSETQAITGTVLPPSACWGQVRYDFIKLIFIPTK